MTDTILILLAVLTLIACVVACLAATMSRTTGDRVDRFERSLEDLSSDVWRIRYAEPSNKHPEPPAPPANLDERLAELERFVAIVQGRDDNGRAFNQRLMADMERALMRADALAEAAAIGNSPAFTTELVAYSAARSKARGVAVAKEKSDD